MEDLHNWEAHVSTTSGQALLTVAQRLPSIWRDRREARRQLKALPRFLGDLPQLTSEQIHSWIEGICQTPHRRPGTSAGHQAEQWVADQMRTIGLEQVSLDPVPITGWEARRWSLRVGKQWIPSFYVVNTGFTDAEGVSAPLVDVGQGRPRDFDRVEVAGKIVVADVSFPVLPTGVLMRGARMSYALSDPSGTVGWLSGQKLNFIRRNFLGGTSGDDAPEDDVYWQAHRRGALGICLVLRDQPSNANSHYGPYDGVMKPMAGLWIGKHDGAKLHRLARAGATATLTLEGTTGEAVMHNVWGVLPGVSDEVVLVTSHHDAPFKGAVEDGAGVAQVLAQAWAWAQLPRSARPRTLVFVIDSGHFYGSAGAHAWARDHRDIMDRVTVLLTLEHLGGKEVRERSGQYQETGKPAFTVMFTTPEPTLIGAVTRALSEHPAPATAAIPADFFGPTPTSDAMGYVKEAGVPVVSWIGCPYYLLDRYDTLDKVDTTTLAPIAATASELVKTFMVM